jgi:hypothetical protein
VRLFRNPSARGTCCQVLGTDGQPLYVDPETDYMEFRRSVGQVPGLYRLDQCDEDGNELEDTQPAYVSIDVARNAQAMDSTGDVSPLLIIQQMAATQAEVMKAMAAQQAALMAATAEILRAPYRPAPIALPAPTPDLRNAATLGKNDDHDEHDGHDESDEDIGPDSPATMALRMLEPHLPQLGAFLYDKCAEFLRHIYSKKATTSPAAMPAPMPASTPAIASMPSQPTGEPVGVAAGASSPVVPRASAATSSATAVMTADAGDDEDEHTGPADMDVVPPPIAGAPTNAPNAPFIPTREQLAHVNAIRARLTPTEQAIVSNTIARMDPQMLSDWLAALSPMPVDEATALIRRMVDEIQQPRAAKTR